MALIFNTIKRSNVMKSKIIMCLFLYFVGLCYAQSTVYLYTPNGSQVTANQGPEMSPSEIASINAYYVSAYPNAELLADASATYNCHSYAWNLTEGGTIICWLNQSPDLHLYWDDGSYEETTGANAVKIFYYNGDHSAVVSHTHAGKYESKWGRAPLMRHSPDYGPSIYNMQYRKYYRRCTNIINFTNQTVTTGKTVANCNDISVQNVTVTSTGTLNLRAGGTITINAPFEVQAGAVLNFQTQ
jgi:hypothetical protein